ncbi:pectinesterase [Lactuca sativa]|uniref:pectinesterase n=1 Tax=Lactuca sativa TaxID=4236 RepID=UPI000CD80655|nr:pectinesterase [Lactuca sativa]
MFISSNKKTTVFLLLFASLLLTSHVHGSGTHLPDSDIIKSSCATTLYPDICYSTLSTTKNPATNKDVIQHAINKTKEIIQGNFNSIKKLTATANLTNRGKLALHDCLEMVAGTLEDLDRVIRELEEYPTKKSLRQHADDLKTLMSTAITNKEACLDGLSYDADCRRLRESIIEGQDLGGKMCSNVLGMITNMTDTDMANYKADSNARKLKEKKVVKWPEWLSRRDRKLLQLLPIGPTPNVIVSKNGKGNYTTVAAAVAAAPAKSKNRYVIKILAGVYRENVEIPKNKTNIMFIGEDKNTTIITGNKSVTGGSTTWLSATVAAMGEGFLARDITFENTAGASGHQAVALRVGSDLSAFYRCNMIAFQDTLYVTSGRQFFVKCTIVGTVDFIFGNAAVVFQLCDILARRPNPHQGNMVTAQGRTDPQQNTGIVIQGCKIAATTDLEPVKANFKTYLGRPWKNYSRTVIMQSFISDVIDPAGWSPWEGDFALNTLYYREYRNWGPGADTSKRVKWKGWGVMWTAFDAMPFSVAVFIDGWYWLPFTGFPFWLLF